MCTWCEGEEEEVCVDNQFCEGAHHQCEVVGDEKGEKNKQGWGGGEGGIKKKGNAAI